MLPDLVKDRRWFSLEDDFLWYISPHLWTALASDSTVTVAIDADGVGGVVQIGIDATNNNEACIATTNEVFKFASDKPLVAEARIQYTEGNVDDANVAFGFADAFGANLIADDGASVGINSSGAIIYKVDGGTVWRCNSEINGVALDSVSTTTAGGSAYQTLRIEAITEGSNVILTYFCDGVQLKDSSGVGIRHELALASATEMDLGVYAKGGTGAETINVDYVGAAQLR